MNEPLDSRPQRTLNRLRLAVAVPVALAGVGILFLAVQFARQFWDREETPTQNSSSSTPAQRDASEPENRPAVALPEGRTRLPAGQSAKAATRSTGSSPATAVEGVTPVVAANTKPGVTTLAIVPLAVNVLTAHAIVGRVVLRGTPPPEKEIPLDPSCGRIHAGKAITRFFAVTTNGALADVFIVLHGLPAARWEPPANALEIWQRGCEYLPYISAAQVGQIIRVFNDDPLMHNVHPTPTIGGNREQNRVQLNAASPPLDHTFPNPESFLRFKCDVHPWMFAYVSVVEHPFFAVSAADGQFSMPEPPPGNYVLQFIHRKAGEKPVPVSVRPGKRIVINVTLDLADPLKHEAVVTEE